MYVSLYQSLYVSLHVSMYVSLHVSMYVSLHVSLYAHSELQRARITADSIARVNPGEARRVIVPGLNEIDFGSTDGISVRRIPPSFFFFFFLDV